MGNKVKSLLLSGSLLASTAMFAAPEAPEAEKLGPRIENVQEANAPSREDLQKKVEEAEAKLPNAFERGMGHVTNAVRTGAGYLATGISYPVRGLGRALGYGGQKAAEGITAGGKAVGLPLTSSMIGSTISTPTRIADATLDFAGKTVDSTVNITTDALMTGLDSAATATRDVNEAGNNFMGGMAKTAGYTVGDTIENTGGVLGGVLGNQGVKVISKAAGTAAHAGGDLADIAIRGDDMKALNNGETVKKFDNRFNQFQYEMKKNITPEMTQAFASGDKEAIGNLFKSGKIQEAGARMFGQIDSALDDAKVLAKEANMEARGNTLKARLKAAEEAKGKLDVFDKTQTEQKATDVSADKATESKTTQLQPQTVAALAQKDR